MKQCWSIICAMVTGTACASSATATPERDAEAARALFTRNIEAIQNKDRDAYLACYRPDASLVRSGPGGAELGYEGLASKTATAPAGWPKSLEATDLQVHPLAPGCVYGSYRYRVTYGDSDIHEGISERVFIERNGRWEIAVSTAFGHPASSDPQLNPVAFLAGEWIQTHAGRTTEEVWSPARAGTMIGYARTFAGNSTVHWEHLRLELDAGAIYYVATPQGQATARFKLTTHAPSTATFENPQHDYPKRIRYRLEGKKLHVRIEGDGKSSEWSFDRR